MQGLPRFFPRMLANIRYPQGRALGFVQMGLGIERRALRYKKTWDPHFQKSREAQRLWLDSTAKKPEHCIIVGAGRLYDCALQEISAQFNTVSVLDADPLCLPMWQKAERTLPKRNVQGEILEITGKYPEWVRAFGDSVKSASFDEALRILSDLPARQAALKTEPQKIPLDLYFATHAPSHVISLNILSQLPVMWQNAIERILIERFGKQLVAERESEWLVSYLPSGRILIRDHLQSLAQSGAASMLLISDVEYFSYPLLAFSWMDPPLTWTENESGGKWSVTGLEDGDELLSECLSYDALMGVNIENKKLLSQLFPAFEAVVKESWLWHILPQAEDGSGLGTVHRVRAIELRRN